MDYNVLDALAMITREKSVDRKIVIDSLVAGLQSAAKKKVGADAVIDARVDESTGEMTVEQVKIVVEQVEVPDAQISLSEALVEFGDQVLPGDEVRWELPLESFGRNAILVAKQILVQKVREAERTQIFEDFRDRANEVVVGTIQQVDRGNVLVNLGRVEALLPYREQIRGEKYHQGKTLKALIIEVLDNAKGPQVILSRSHPEFLKSLFDQEVPEIQEGIVEIKAVAREPGTRSKIAVVSRDDRVDAVGSCVGMKGSRVQAVTRELAGERIDIVPWSAEPSLLISRALSPAEVSSIVLNEERHEATVIVSDDQLSKAIGKEGKNVRLAAKLTEWKIDLISAKEHHIRQRITQEMSMELDEMSGVTSRISGLLREAGISTIAHLAAATSERLEAIPGIGPKTAEALMGTARATLDELHQQIEAAVTEELARVAAEEKDLFDSSVFSDEQAPPAVAKEPTGPEDVPMPEGNLFEGFDELVERDGPPDEEPPGPKVDPFAGSGLDD